MFDEFFDTYLVPKSLQNDHDLIEYLNDTSIIECFDYCAKEKETMGTFVKVYNQLYGTHKTVAELLEKYY